MSNEQDYYIVRITFSVEGTPPCIPMVDSEEFRYEWPPSNSEIRDLLRRIWKRLRDQSTLHDRRRITCVKVIECQENAFDLDLHIFDSQRPVTPDDLVNSYLDSF